MYESITDFYIKKGYIPADKREIYTYGFRLIISDIIEFSIVIALGVIMGKAAESLIFLITLCGVRLFAGGYHAKKYWLCRLSMVITFLSVIAVYDMLISIAGTAVIALADAVFVIAILLLAPVKHPNKKLTERQRIKNKIRAVITSFAFSVMSVVLTVLGRSEGIIISVTLAAVAVLMIIGIFTNGKKENANV